MNLLLEGDDLEALLLRASREGGSSARIVRAEKVRRGGVLGFFAKEGFEVAVEIPKDDEPADDAGPTFDQTLAEVAEVAEPAAKPARKSTGRKPAARKPGPRTATARKKKAAPGSTPAADSPAVGSAAAAAAGQAPADALLDLAERTSAAERAAALAVARQAAFEATMREEMATPPEPDDEFAQSDGEFAASGGQFEVADYSEVQAEYATEYGTEYEPDSRIEPTSEPADDDEAELPDEFQVELPDEFQDEAEYQVEDGEQLEDDARAEIDLRTEVEATTPAMPWFPTRSMVHREPAPTAGPHVEPQIEPHAEPRVELAAEPQPRVTADPPAFTKPDFPEDRPWPGQAGLDTSLTPAWPNRRPELNETGPATDLPKVTDAPGSTDPVADAPRPDPVAEASRPVSTDSGLWFDTPPAAEPFEAVVPGAAGSTGSPRQIVSALFDQLGSRLSRGRSDATAVETAPETAATPTFEAAAPAPAPAVAAAAPFPAPPVQAPAPVPAPAAPAAPATPVQAALPIDVPPVAGPPRRTELADLIQAADEAHAEDPHDAVDADHLAVPTAAFPPIPGLTPGPLASPFPPATPFPPAAPMPDGPSAVGPSAADSLTSSPMPTPMTPAPAVAAPFPATLAPDKTFGPAAGTPAGWDTVLHPAADPSPEATSATPAEAPPAPHRTAATWTGVTTALAAPEMQWNGSLPMGEGEMAGLASPRATTIVPRTKPRRGSVRSNRSLPNQRPAAHGESDGSFGSDLAEAGPTDDLLVDDHEATAEADPVQSRNFSYADDAEQLEDEARELKTTESAWRLLRGWRPGARRRNATEDRDLEAQQWTADDIEPALEPGEASTAFAEAATQGLVPAASSVIDSGRLDADRAALCELGVPAAWTEELTAGDRFTSIVRMLGRLAEPRIQDDAAVIAVVGPADVVELEAHRTALDLPAKGRPRAVTLVPGQTGVDRRAAIARSKRIRPVIISIPIGSYADPAATRAVLDSVKAEAVIAVIDADRPLAEISSWIEALGRVDAIALDGALDAGHPAAVLGLDVPVIRVDGISVDRIGWAALLCAQLAALESVQ